MADMDVNAYLSDKYKRNDNHDFESLIKEQAKKMRAMGADSLLDRSTGITTTSDRMKDMPINRMEK